jgi:mannosyltransferase OCH1-like enzyme
MSSATRHQVPKHLHQIWFDFSSDGSGKGMPEKYRTISEQWRQLHPDYHYSLWDDSSAQSLVAERYPWLLETYLGLAEKIYQVDLFRYLLMHSYGGVYLDTDMIPLKRLDPLLHVSEVVLFEQPLAPEFLNNTPLISVPGHQFWLHVMKKFLQSASVLGRVKNSFIATMSVAGPLFLTICCNSYPQSHKSQKIRVLSGAFFSAHPQHRQVAFASHTSDTSWGIGRQAKADLARLAAAGLVAFFIFHGLSNSNN